MLRVLVAALVLAAATSSGPRAVAQDPVVVAAGDIACDPANPFFNDGFGRGPHCRHRAVARVIEGLDPVAVFALGDNQYDEGSLRQFRRSYDLWWGAFAGITRPVPGNHEYGTGAARGYFDYFGASAGRRGRGYYSFDVGTWHVIALNSNCWKVGCARGSRQHDWLRADLRASAAACTLAYWHHPRFSSGPHGKHPSVRPFWRLLYRWGGDVVLNGHDHLYERFALLTPAGRRDREGGIREFVVGTGGAQHYRFQHILPHSQARNARAFGVLRLELGDGRYGWRFVPQRGRTYSDRGTARCR